MQCTIRVLQTVYPKGMLGTLQGAACASMEQQHALGIERRGEPPAGSFPDCTPAAAAAVGC